MYLFVLVSTVGFIVNMLSVLIYHVFYINFVLQFYLNLFVPSVAVKQKRRFLPHALIYPFWIFKLGKFGHTSSICFSIIYF